METVNIELNNLDPVRYAQAVSTVDIIEKAGRSLSGVLRVVNPELAAFSEIAIDQNTHGLEAVASEQIKAAVTKSLLLTEAYSSSIASVQLSHRAHYLSQLVSSKAISQFRMLDGFKSAASEESKHLPEVKDFYKYGFYIVKYNALNKRDRLYGQIRRDFAYAVGHYTVINSSSVSTALVEDVTRKEFDDFVEKYYIDPHAKKNREALLQQLSLYIKN